MNLFEKYQVIYHQGTFPNNPAVRMTRKGFHHVICTPPLNKNSNYIFYGLKDSFVDLDDVKLLKNIKVFEPNQLDIEVGSYSPKATKYTVLLESIGKEASFPIHLRYGKFQSLPNTTKNVTMGLMCSYPSMNHCLQIDAIIPVGIENHSSTIVSCTISIYLIGFVFVLLKLLRK